MSFAELYKYVKLATAGYVDLTGLLQFGAEVLELRAAEQSRFPAALGRQFFTTDGWAVLGDPRHTNGSHNSASGLAATLFGKPGTNGNPGEKVLAVRGTEGSEVNAALYLDLVQADLGEIGGFGIAISQLVDLVNLVFRHQAAQGETGVLQLSLKKGFIPPSGAPVVSVAGVSHWLEGHYNGVGVGGLSPGDTLTVVGHSLGGHLAAMLHRLMPGQFTQAVVFNSARYDPPSSQGLTSQFLSLFGQWGLAPSGGFNNVSMFDSEDQAPGDDISGVSSLITGSLYGPLQAVITETNSHVIEPFMGSLSLHALMARMNPSLSLTESGQILQAMSQREANSDEGLLAALYKVLKGQALQSTDLTEFGAGLFGAGDIDARQKFYVKLLEAEAAANSGLQLIPLSNISVTNLIEGATGALDATHDVTLAYRYALRELNPFIITGSEALYAPHNTGANVGKLDLYDLVNRDGQLTAEWIADRAAFLAWKNLANTADVTTVLRPEFTTGNRAFFEDHASAYATTISDAVLPPVDDTTRRFVFGSDASDLLNGGQYSDRLYGGAGTDYLRGKLNNDHLEGGAGLDVYEYNSYANGANDGVDIILDTDGKGILRYVWNAGAASTSTAVLDASIRLSSTQWQSADGKFRYTKTAGEAGRTDLVVAIQGDAGGQFMLKNWRDGDFNIYLREARDLPATGNMIRGDLEPLDNDPATAGIQTTTNPLGNIEFSANAAPDREDTLYGNRLGDTSTAGEKIESGGGNDIVFSDRPRGEADNGAGNIDWIVAGAGRDIIEAGAGNDLIEAGSDGTTAAESGGDIADAGDGDDTVYAESAIALSDAIAQGNLDNPTNVKGDFIYGGAGEDWLVGARGDDILNGGAGKDLIIGGAGHDIIDGDIAESAAILEWNVTRQIVAGPNNQVIDYVVSTTGLVDRSGIPVDVDAGEADVIYGGSGEDWIYARGGDDFVDGGSQNDILIGGAGADVLIGGADNDVLWGDKGNAHLGVSDGGDYLDGGAGNDVLEGHGGGDILVGGIGNDTLNGGIGRDIYVYNRGDGIDTIIDPDDMDGTLDAQGKNTNKDKSIIVFGDGISSGQIKFRKGSLLIDLGASDPADPAAGNDQIHIEGFNPGVPQLNAVVGELRFADGSIMTYDDILAQGFDLDGTAGDDIIDGTGVTDRINGFAGNDDIAAFEGNDVIDAGEGDDVVEAGTGDNTVYGGAGNDDIRTFSGHDIVDGGDGDDTISTESGNDWVEGGAGADTIAAGAGSDQVSGGAGDDVLDGGAGNDTLSGGAGRDAYLLYAGIGRDTVTDGLEGESNVIDIVGGLTAGNVRAVREGDALRVFLRGTTDALVISDYNTRPQQWVLRDALGTEIDLAALVDLPDPSTGDLVSKLWAEAKDRQIASAVGRAYAVGWKPLGSADGGYLFNQFTQDAYLYHWQETTTTTPYQIVFNDLGSTQINSESSVETVFEDRIESYDSWSQASVQTGQQISDAPLIHGTTLLAQQQVQSDVWIELRPDRRTFNNLTASSSQSFIIDTIENGSQTIHIGIRFDRESASYNRFARATYRNFDGPETTQPGIINGNRARLNVQRYVSSYLAVNEIIAGASNNTIVVNGGNDFTGLVTLVDAGAGNDTITGDSWAVNGLFYGGAGNDIISGTGSTLIGGDGADRLTGAGGTRFVYTAAEAGVDQIENNSTYSMTYYDWYYQSLGIANWVVRDEQEGRYEAAYETDGISYNYYDSYAEAFAAHPEAVITYMEPLPAPPIVLRNDRASMEVLAAAGVLAVDTVVFGEGVSWSDLSFTVMANEELAGYPGQPLSGGGALSVRWGDAGFDVALPELNYGFTGELASYRLGEGVEFFEFADGSRYTLDELLTQAAAYYEYADGRIYQAGLDDDDFFIGGFNNDTLLGRGGDDFLLGGEGDDVISGGEGDDSLVGDEGNDVLEGGSGADSLSGGAGADRYRFGPGGGRDELNVDVDDIVEIAAPLADVQFSRVYGFDLQASLRGSSDSMVFTGWFEDSIFNFEPAQTAAGFEFADGAFLAAAGVDALLEVTAATAGDDLIGGTAANDVIDGFEGADEIYGNGGEDIIRGGAGDDYLNAAIFAGRSILDGGAGDDSIYDEIGGQFVIGGAGNDVVNAYGASAPSIIAFNPGDGHDTIYAAESLVLSLGGGITPADLGLALDAETDDLILAVGANDSIRLTREFEADPQAWPPITLQLFGSAHLYDFNSAIAALYSHTGTELALGDVLPALEFESSESAGLGGALANHYQLHGNLDGLSAAEAVSVLADEGFGSALQALELTAPNRRPVLADSIGPRFASEDAELQLTVDAGTFVDPDAGDTLTFDASMADGSALPAWLSFDAATRTFSGTPANDDVGALTIRVTASDAAGESVSDVFTLDVLNTNDAPVATQTIAAQAATEDQAFQFVLPAGIFADVDAGDTLSYAASLGNGAALPEWLSFDEATGSFSGTPANADTGSLDIRVTATDAAGDAVSSVFELSVAGVNDAPALVNPLTDQAVTAGVQFHYAIPADTFADVDAGDSVTLSAQLADGSALPAWLAFDAASGTFTGTFSGVPSASNVGVLDVEVTATDTAGTTGNDRFMLTVNPAAGLTLTGTAVADTLNGGYGNDLIDGLAGIDQLIGGDGDDTYVVDHAADAVVELSGQGHDVVQSSVTYTLAAEVEDLVLTGTLNRNGSGNAWANTLTGNAGANRLDGGAGADVLIGGLGNDTYVVDDAQDQVFEAAVAGTDTVQSSISHALAADVENLLLTGDAAIDGFGNELANVLTGNAAGNLLAGGAGNDRLTGGAGIDTLAGGIGNDTYVIDNNEDFIIELAGEGSDTVQASLNFSLAEHLENLTLTGDALSGSGNAAANRLTGNALDNLLTGLEGNDVLNGAAGIDTLIGGAGNDVYVIDNALDIIHELAGEGTDSAQSTVSFSLAAEVENLVLTGSAAIDGGGNTLNNRLTGNAADNTLQGFEGNDILDGRAGIDILAGGAGNDSYYIDNAADFIVELEGEGADAAISSVSYVLADHVEKLTLSGTAAIDGSGNAGANVLIGNAAGNRLDGLGGDDLLDGKAGADVLAGGAGNDVYVVDQAGDTVIELADEGIDTVQSAGAWILGEHIENLTLTAAAAVNGAGNGLDNVLTGNNAVNTLEGFGGNDWLDGKGGNDLLLGGTGDDVYVVAQAGDTVVELADEGLDTVRASISYTLGDQVEQLVLTGTAGIRATGNAGANTLTGNSGNNQLDGLAGADLLIGGAGNDTYIIDDAGDTVVEAADEGVDLVKSSLSHTLAAHVENLTLTGAVAIDGGGNTLNNIMLGNAAANALAGEAGDDVLNGGRGADVLSGGAGNDAYVVDNAGDTVIELAGGGIDTVNTALSWTLGEQIENLNLTGGSNRNATGNLLDNTIAGNRGANILNGMAGNDTLAGGLGNDTYRFDPGFGHDVIAEDDATAGNLDRIQFGAGIAATDIVLGRLDDDLVVHTADRQHSIQVMDWFAADAHRIERIEFASGAFWDMAAIESGAMQSVDMPGLLRGDSQASVLLGQIGNTVLEGGEGDDTLTDEDGNNLFSGGDGDDVATGGEGNDLFAGGSGNDTLVTGGGSNVIAFNAGGGIDTVYSDSAAENTLSLGGGLSYADLSLSRDNNDLVLNTGADDKVVLKDWYVGNSSLLNLQIILDATGDYDAESMDPLYNQRVQNFDFLALVSAFDAAQAANPGIGQWALGDALTQYHLAGSSDAALGGDLAYWYARNSSFTGIGLGAAQQIIGAPGFGAEAQGLREFAGLQEGLVRLG